MRSQFNFDVRWKCVLANDVSPMPSIDGLIN